MLNAVLVFGVLIGLMSLYGIIAPQSLLDMVRQVSSSRIGLVFAVLIRLVLGCVFLLAAPLTAFPNAFYFLGVLALFSGAILLFLGQGRMTGLVEWFQSQPSILTRLYLLFGLAFASFLVYAGATA